MGEIRVMKVRYWTAAEDAQLRDLLLDHSYLAIAKILGRSESAVTQRVSILMEKGFLRGRRSVGGRVTRPRPGVTVHRIV